MKNFIKRTFTKAIAVAAAASIAAGVLAGCNTQPNVEKDDVETGFQSIMQSIEIGNETFRMCVDGYEYNNDSHILAVDVSVANFSDKDITIVSGTAGEGEVSVKAYADAVTSLEGSPLNGVDFASDESCLWGKTVSAKTGSSAGVAIGKLYFQVIPKYKDWNAVTMIATVNSSNITDTSEGKLEFVINR